MSYFWSILGVLIICYSCFLWNIYSYWRRRGVVGPTPLPIVGNYGLVLLRIKSEKEVLKEIYNDYPNAKCIGIYIGTSPVLVLKDHDMIKQVIVQHTNHFQDRFSVLNRYKKSLPLMPGDRKWAVLRQSISPTFSNLKMAKFSFLTNSCVNKYLEFVDELVSNEATHSVFALKSKLMQEVASKLMFGLDFDEVCKEADLVKFCKTLCNAELLVIYRVLSGFPLVMKIISPVANFFSFKVYKYFLELITSLLRKRENNVLKIDTMLNIMLTKIKANDYTRKPGNNETKGQRIDMEGVAQNASSFFFAFIINIPHQLTYWIHELVQNQHIQHKCYEEIMLIYNSSDETMTYDVMPSKMKYLEMVLDEVLRKYGPILMDRICTAKYTFTDSSLSVDKGVSVIVPLDAIHNDAKYFPNPGTFDPERFSSKNWATIPRYAYMPFGDGPRSCIGKQLSKMLMLKIMAAFLKKFRLLPSKLTEDEVQEDTTSRARIIYGEVVVSIQKRKDTIE